MADLKTSQEAAAAPLTGAELVRGVQSGGNVKMTTAAIAALYTPTTAKGDLIARGVSGDVRLPVGADTLQLVADSTQAAGVKWYDAIGAAVANFATSAGATLVGLLQAGTGAAPRTVATKFAETLSVNDYNSVSSADAAAAVAGKPLLFPAGTYSLPGNQTFASHVVMQAGARIVSSGTVIFANGFEAPASAYCLNVSGYVQFIGCDRVLPQWFGAMGDAVYAAGSMTSGSNALSITLPPPGTTVPGFSNGDTIFVRGAGPAGAVLATTITSGAGTNSLVLAANASTTVSSAEVANRDNTLSLQRFFAAFKGAANVGSYGASLPSSTGCAKAYIPKGVYTAFGQVSMYSGTVVEGEFGNTIGGAILVQANISAPLLNVVADNFDSAGASLNGGSGNNIWRNLAFKSATINDALANAPVVFFQNAWNTHSDSEFDHCLFQSTAGACIGAGFQTTGSITSGTNTLTLANGSTLRNGNNAGGMVTVRGAGAAGADLVTYIVSGGGTGSVVLHDNAGTTVSGAVVVLTSETVNPLKVTDCEFDVVRSGIEFGANVSGQIVVSNTEAYQCVRGFIRNTSTGNVDTQVRGGNVIGCGNTQNSTGAYRRAIYQDAGSTGVGSLTLQGVTLVSGIAGYGGPVWFQGTNVTITDCDMTDCDTADLQKFVLAIAKNYKIKDNRLTSNAIASYSNARMVSFSNPTMPTSWDVSGNDLVNNGGSAFDRAIHSDYPIQGGICVDNLFVGGFTAPVDANIATLRNAQIPSMGSGPVDSFGTAAPAVGTWKQGDKCWNTSPTNAAGQVAGWVCVSAGTPGTWRGFGVTI